MPVKKSRSRSKKTSRRLVTEHPHVRATNEFLSGNIHWFFKTLGSLIAILTFLVALLALLAVMNGGPSYAASLTY